MKNDFHAEINFVQIQHITRRLNNIFAYFSEDSKHLYTKKRLLKPS